MRERDGNMEKKNQIKNYNREKKYDF